MIIIDVNSQTLFLNNTQSYSISSAKNGLGQLEGSNKTPKGLHSICDKIGGCMPKYSVFVGRVHTGEVYTKKLGQQHPNRDWILSRILWLDGKENFNKNTKQRYIYIHGTADESSIGIPTSKGCIRMKNTDVIDLFNKVKINDEIFIK